MMLRQERFHVYEYDEHSLESPGYVGDPRGGGVYAGWFSSPDLDVAEGFYVEVKSKGRTTWTWKKGKRYEHGFPERQFIGYQELGRVSGKREACRHLH